MTDGAIQAVVEASRIAADDIVPKVNGSAAETNAPEPLDSETEAEKAYPIDALPELMRAAVVEYQAYGQQPVAMVAVSALSALSLAAQHLADVARDPALISPCSLNTLVIAEFGERKTSCDRAMTKQLRAAEVEKRTEVDERTISHNVAMLDFKHRREAQDDLLKAARREKGGGEAKADAARKALEDIDRSEPIAPRERIIFHEDSTAEQLVLDLAAGWPSSSVWSSEGGIVAGGHAMRDERAMATIALLNTLWDGQPYRRRRARAENAELVGVRLTCSIMVQPIVFRHLATLAGGAVRGMGLFARFLLAWPTSTMGTRMYKPPADGSPAMAAFQTRLVELMAIEPEFPTDERGRTVYQLNPDVVGLSAEAFNAWRQFHDDVERELGAEGEFAELRDVAAKIADNACRLAALFHLLQHGGPVSEIGAHHMQAGIAVAAWHLCEARRVFGMAKRDAVIDAAIALLKWMIKADGDEFADRDIRRGPRVLRDDPTLRGAVIGVLVDRGWGVRKTTARAGRFRLRADAERHARDQGLIK